MSKNEELATIDPMALAVGGALPMQTADDEIEGGAGSNYVCFAHPMNKQFSKMAAKGMREPDPVLFIAGEPVKLDPFRMFMPTEYKSQYWAQVDPRGNITIASLKREGAFPWGEYIDAIIFVLYGHGQIAPARVTWKKARAKAAREAIAGVVEASDPAWAAKGKDYAFAAAVKLPYARVVFTVTQEKHEPKEEAKKRGSTGYYDASSSGSPVGAADFDTLRKAYTDPGFIEQFKACHADLTQRLTFIKSKVPA
jgi:hypothetical protein